MFARAFLLGLLIFHMGLLFTRAQNNTQTIRGVVRDADNKTPLTGAAVQVRNISGKSSVSNEEGQFRIREVPVGRQQIEVYLLGYNPAILNNVDVTSGKEIVLEIELSEKVYQTKEVVIEGSGPTNQAGNELSTLSARSFNREETNRYAGSRGDPSKMVANYAGVSSGNDARNDIIVRGNSPLGVLWRLEGVDIPNPNHFSAQGATGGPISILNNNLLASSDFFTGAWPAEFGNKVAAVFDLKLRNGNNEKNEFTGQIGINGFELGAEGPVQKRNNSSYLVNYRYSTLDAFTALGINFGVSGQPRYQDLSFKLNLPANRWGTFSLWGIGGKSNIALLDSKKKSGDWSFTSAGTDLIYGSSMSAAGISNIHYLTPSIYGKIVLSSGTGRFTATVDTLSVNNDKFRTFENNNLEGQQQAQYLLSAKLNRKNLLKSGINFTLLNFKYTQSQYSRFYKTYLSVLNENSNAALVKYFLAWQHKFSDNLTLNTGCYGQYFMLNNRFSAEPRLGLKWQLLPAHTLSFAAGIHSQMQPLVYYFFKTYTFSSNSYTYTNKDLGFTFSRHLVLAYDWSFANNWRIKSENYLQQLWDVPVEGARTNYFSMLNAGSDIDGLELLDSLVNQGKGYNYGTELTIEKFFSGHYYLMGTFSLYKSRYYGSDRVWRYSAFSGTYVGNILFGYEWPLKQQKYILAIDSKATTAGGNRYTPVNLPESRIAGRAVYVSEQAYEKKFAPYKKIDVKISMRYNGKKTAQSLYFSLENIFGWKNILRQYYDPRLAVLKTEYQFGLFPIGGYRIEF